MQIRLVSLKLKNFKGIRDFTLKVDGKNANVYGDNGAGKTTIFDAFMWLLFDKDSQNRKDFGIKTYNNNGNVIHGLEHEVEAVLSIDNKPITLRKVYKEKWTKRKGEAERTMTGHETVFFIDEVPKSKSEYTEKIGSIISEDIFKLITNVLYFNTVMKWQDRRTLLLEVLGDIPDSEVFNSDEELQKLQAIVGDKSIDDFKKMIAAQHARLNKEIKEIPARIDEVYRNMPELDGSIDYAALEAEKSTLDSQLNDIEIKMTQATNAANEFRKKQSEVFAKKNQIESLKREIEKAAYSEVEKLKARKRELLYEKEDTESMIKRNNEVIARNKDNIINWEQEIKKLVEQWNTEKAKQFVAPDDSNFICPVCKQNLPEDQKESQIEKLKKNFEDNKTVILSTISVNGKSLKKSIDDAKEDIKSRETKNAELSDILSTINDKLKEVEEKLNIPVQEVNFDDNEQYTALKNEIAAMKNELSNASSIDTESLILEKQRINSRINDINATLNNREVIEKSKARIEELKQEEKNLSQQILNIEKQQFLCDKFTKAKVNMLEDRINQKFKFVRFKMFDTQVNGSIVDCCEALINGVPFSDANNAAKINAGLDIINTLTKHYDIFAPIFIDNKESINELIDTDSQVIGLIVSKDKTLRVEVEE